MKIALNQKQMNFLKSKALNTGFVAGLGSGKSFVSTLKTILKKVKFPNATVAYYLPTYGLIRDIAFDKFPTMLSDMGYTYKLNKSDKEIHIDNYGKIIFRSMDNPENIVGYETFYTLIDECDILNMDKMTTAYNKILGRNRQVCYVEDKEILSNWSIPLAFPDGTYYHKNLRRLCWSNQMDIVGTPEGFKIFYNRYVKELDNETDILIKASTYENKHLHPNYIKGLEKQYPPNLLKAYLNGDFINLTSGVVYKYFDRTKHHTDAEIEEGEALFIGQDFNIGGCCGAVCVIRKGMLMQLDEYSCYDTQAIVLHLQNKYKGHSICITPDASGNANKTNASKTDIKLLKDGGFNIDAPLKNPFVKDRVNTLNNMFYQNTILINTHKCPESTQALEQQAYDDNGEPEKQSGANTLDDRNDGLGYISHRKFGIDKAIATDGNLRFF